MDPGALDHFGASSDDGHVSFDHAGYRVAVDSSGDVAVADATTGR